MKKIIALTLAGIMAFSLAACSNDDDNKASGDDKILIYSNSVSDGRDVWITERALEDGFDIEVVNIPGGELTNRLIAEKNNSLADMVFGLNTLEYEKLKAEDMLLKYEPIWAKEVDMNLGDADGYYYPIVIQPLVLAMDPSLTDMPSDWTDLSDPKYTDKYTVLGLGGGTSRTVLASIISRYPDPNGEYGISDEGWAVTKGYIQNAHLEVAGEDYVGAVVEGTRPMTMLWGSGVIQNQNEREFEFEIMSPEIGVPYVTEQTAIISTTDKVEACEEFINWFGSSKIQAEWSNEFGTIPAHPDALEVASQDVKDFMAKVPTPQVLDWTFIAENIDKWAEKVELEFVK